MINWDWLISAAIIIALILTVWAKVSKQTIPELIADLIDRAKGTGEDTIDYAMEIYE